MKKENYIFASITTFFSLLFIIMTFQFSASNSINKIGPRFWPMMVLTIMLVLSIILIVKTKVQSYTDDEYTPEKENKTVRLFRLPIILIISLIVAVYIALLNVIGFLLSTLLFTYPVALLLGMKKKLSAFFLSVIATAAFIAIFGGLLNIPLPRGIGVFREMSFYFY